MNFREPQEKRIINGFPVAFSAYVTPTGLQLWVPSRISRNEPSLTWRVSFYSTRSPVQRYFPDAGRSPEISLSEAWEFLLGLLESHTSVHRVDERPRQAGPPRIALTKTGVTGVMILRLSGKSRWPSVVVACQQLQYINQRVKSRQIVTGRIPRSKYIDDPERYTRFFDQALRDAVALRRYYNHVTSKSGQTYSIIPLSDVPRSFRDMPFEHNLDLDKIIWSF